MVSEVKRKLSTINIVMVEPEIPQNTGNVARTCAATGARLHLVGPLGFSVSDRQLKRAGLDYWKYLDVTYYQDIEEFFAKNNGDFYYFTTKGRQVHSAVSYPDHCYLLFGRETKGLPEELLIKNPERCVRIPMAGGIRSLNLANSVSIGVYEVLRQWNYPALENFGQLHNYRWEDVL